MHVRQAYLAQLSALYDEEEAKSLFQIAAEELLQLSRISLTMSLQQTWPAEALTPLWNCLERLKQGEPIQHIFGRAPFFGYTFRVDEHTLIPRPETEELVDLILHENQQQPRLHLIDIGTGSGCIAISLQKNLPNSTVTAVDVSKEALSVARANAETLEAAVEFRCLDILEWELAFGEEQFDIVVSNPPYITQSEKQAMHTNVLQHEPHTALFVPEEAPLLFYDYIADFALHHLSANGKLYFEINQYLANETKDLIQKKGFKDVKIINDINGVARMLSARK